MTEQEANTKLEELCGSVDRAFRLMHIWQQSREIVSGDRFRMGHRERDVADVFIPKAKEYGYSSEAITHYISHVV